jgi:exopolysaccharide biosynthesis polyprenyl glycosylphosphotransferase
MFCSRSSSPRKRFALSGMINPMHRNRSIDLILLSIALDAGLAAVMFVLAVLYRPFLSQLSFAQDINSVSSIPTCLYFLLPAAWEFCLLLFSVYHPQRNIHFKDEAVSLLLGSLLAGVTLSGVVYLTYRDLSRVLFLSFILATFLAQFLWRILRQLVIRFGKASFSPPHRVLIVGAGMVGVELQEKISSDLSGRMEFAGFLDDDPLKAASDDRVLGTLDDTRPTIQKHRIEYIILALPQRAHERAARLVTDLLDLPVEVLVVPDYFALSLHHAAVEEFAGIPMLDLRAPALSVTQRLIKRVFDIAFTLACMPFALPIMGLIAIAIRMTSAGPVIFIQERVGENCRPLKMYKFRTMVNNAEQLRHLVERYDEQGRLLHKVMDDPRVTKLGAFLRRMSLDEVPQLFNILRGQMSWVGPRPEMPRLVEKYEPWQRKRFAVPPGLTGWWQVHGRSDKPMHLHTEEDLYYIQNYSLWLDLAIIFQTIGVVLSRKGAY